MPKYQLFPINFKQANSTLIGGANAKDIPCYKDKGQVVTKWKLQGFWERLLFLTRGEVSVICLGDTQPPMSLRIDEPFESKNNE